MLRARALPLWVDVRALMDERERLSRRAFAAATSLQLRQSLPASLALGEIGSQSVTRQCSQRRVARARQDDDDDEAAVAAIVTTASTTTTTQLILNQCTRCNSHANARPHTHTALSRTNSSSSSHCGLSNYSLSSPRAHIVVCAMCRKMSSCHALARARASKYVCATHTHTHIFTSLSACAIANSVCEKHDT